MLHWTDPLDQNAMTLLVADLQHNVCLGVQTERHMQRLASRPGDVPKCTHRARRRDPFFTSAFINPTADHFDLHGREWFSAKRHTVAFPAASIDVVYEQTAIGVS